MAKKQLKLGTAVHGAGATKWGWRQPAARPDASIDVGHYQEVARRAEAARLDFVFIVDSPYITAHSAPHFLNRLEPLTALSALAATTSRIGLVGTATTSFTEPFTLARQFASLDNLSHGRAGWNVVTTGLEGAAQNYSRDKHYDHEDRYRRAADGFILGLGAAESFERFTDQVVPLLQERGLFRSDYQHRTLRGHLGLPVPANRQARVREAAE